MRLPIVPLVALIAAGGCFGVDPGRVEDDPPDPAVEEALARAATTVPLAREDQTDLYCLEVSVNGKPFWAAVDSGAEGVVFARRIAGLAGIALAEEPGAYVEGSDGARAAVFVGVIEELKVGPVTVRGDRMTFVDLGTVGDIRVDGIAHVRGAQLGAGFLARSKIAVDYERDRLIVPDGPTPGAVASVYERAGYPAVAMLARGGRYYVPAAIGGREVALLCDTGASATSLTEAAVADLGLAITSEPGRVRALGTDERGLRVAIAPKLRIGPMELTDGRMLVLGAGGDDVVDGRPVVGVLGTNILGPVGAIVDFGSGRLFVGGARTP